MEFKNLFNKSPASKIEGLEGQIKAERMKLMSSEEQLKTELASVGGFEGLNKKISTLKDNLTGHKVGVGLATVGAACAGVMLAHAVGAPFTHPGPLGESAEAAQMFHAGFPAVLTAGSAALGLHQSFKTVATWWEKKKLENLKEKTVAQGITG